MTARAESCSPASSGSRRPPRRRRRTAFTTAACLRAGACLSTRARRRSAISRACSRIVARADAVFVGEQHDDPNTHRLELAIVEGLTPPRRPGDRLARDVRARRAGGRRRYSAGKISEEQFLKASRPWPRYATDYRPLVEFAKAHRLPVVASNVPRRLASSVAQDGLTARREARPDARTALTSVSARRRLRRAQTSGRHHLTTASPRCASRIPASARPGESAGGAATPAQRLKLLSVAVREGRDDGGGDRRAHSQDATAASPSCTSTARSTATSAKAPPSAPAAACPAAASPSSRSSGRGSRHARARRRGTEARPTISSTPIARPRARSQGSYRSRSGMSAIT